MAVVDPVRVMIVDDQVDLIETMVRGFKKSGIIEVVQVFHSGIEAVSYCESLPTDQIDWPMELILMDLRMPGMHGIEAAKRIRCHLRRLPILFLTYELKREYLEAYLGYIPLTYDTLFIDRHEKKISEIVQIIYEYIRYNKRYVEESFENQLASLTHVIQAGTPRERLLEYGDNHWQVAQLMAEGLEYDQIADYLGLSEATLKKNYTGEIFQALGLEAGSPHVNRARVARMILRNEFIDYSHLDIHSITINRGSRNKLGDKS